MKAKSDKPTYNRYARSRWKGAEWVHGRGRWASLAWCRYLTIALFDRKENAVRAKEFIDKCGCGGCCYRRHEIVDLAPFARPPKGYTGE